MYSTAGGLSIFIFKKKLIFAVINTVAANMEILFCVFDEL